MAISYAKAGASGIALLARSDLSQTVAEVGQAASDAGRAIPHILDLKCDTTSASDVATAAETITTEFGGRLDILINNAGYLETWRPVAESDPDEWWKTWEVNVKGTYLMTRAFLPLLLSPNSKDGLKTIIQVSSFGGVVISPSASAYQSSKTAVIRFNDYLMAEYGGHGLLAFALHPGGVKTDLAVGMPEYMHEILVDTPELCGDAVVWLTRERRPWLADRFVSVTWDMEELLAKRREIEDGNLLRLRLRF